MQPHPIVTTALVEARRADALRRSQQSAPPQRPRRRLRLVARARALVATWVRPRTHRPPATAFGAAAHRAPPWISRTAAIAPSPHSPSHR